MKQKKGKTKLIGLEDGEKDLRGMKVERWRQRQSIGKNGRP